MKNLRLLSLAALILIVFSCKKEENNDLANHTKSEIEFNISVSNLSEGTKSGNELKSALEIDDAKTIVLTIQKANGESTNYNSGKINVYKMDDVFFSEKISLETGDYKLTQFLLLDADENTIYATPLSGSQQAQNIDNPLSLDFSNTKDQITSVTVEVLSTENLSPRDFGLVGFLFSETPTFSFLINVSKKGQMDSLITSMLTVTKDTYTYSQELKAVANNVVTIKDGLSDYTLTITKPGYIDILVTLSNENLKNYTGVPLTIELELSLTGTVTDYEGNVYKTIKIGNQWWMAENLKATRYNDGTDIPIVSDDATWSGLTTPAYCWYNNDQATYKDTYGALYNWYTVNTGNLAPEGWHVPSHEEWTELFEFLAANGHSGNEGSALKATSGWSNGANGTDDFNFNALPSGRRFGEFQNIGSYCYWWSSTPRQDIVTTAAAINWFLYPNSSNYGNYPSYVGSSIRCIKD